MPNSRAEWYLNGRSTADPLLCNLPSPPDGLIWIFLWVKTLTPSSNLEVHCTNTLRFLLKWSVSVYEYICVCIYIWGTVDQRGWYEYQCQKLLMYFKGFKENYIVELSFDILLIIIIIRQKRMIMIIVIITFWWIITLTMSCAYIWKLSVMCNIAFVHQSTYHVWINVKSVEREHASVIFAERA